MNRFTFFWLPHHSFLRRLRAKWAGKTDGKVIIPGPDDRDNQGKLLFSPYEMLIKQKIDYSIRHLAGDWRSTDRPLHERYCRLQAELASLGNQIKRGDGLLEELEQKHEVALQEQKPFLKELRLTKTVYWPLLLLLALGEFPLNAQVFKIFGERTTMTYLFAGFLAIVLPASAHFLGLLLKRSPFHRESRLEAILTVVAILLPLSLIVAIAYLRQKFLESQGVSSALGIQMTPAAMTAVFISFNIVIFFVAAIASYFAHDQGFDYAQDSFRNTKQSVAACQRQLAILRKRQAAVDEQLAELVARRNSIYEEYRVRAASIKDNMQVLIEVYREHNLRARAKQGSGAGRPSSFADYPPLNTNAVMPATLSWQCDQKNIAALTQTAKSPSPTP
jgi:type III secretory pathway component EscR